MTDHRHNGEFHRADPAYRRRMQILLVAVALLGLGALAALHWWLSSLGARSAGDFGEYERSLYRALGGLSITLAVAAAAFSLWLFRLAAATRAERRWPPASMRTSADVRIRYLTSADSMVTQMKGGASVLALLALGLCAWGVWLWLSA